MKILADRKYLWVTWRPLSAAPRPDGRRYRFQHNKRPSNVYVQVGHLEAVAWYR